MFVTLMVGIAVLMVPPVERWKRGPQLEVDEQQFFLAVHGELRAGSSLRHAIARAAQAQPGPIAAEIHGAADSFESIPALCRALSRLPEMGSMAAMATRVAAESGGRAASVFLRLADRARESDDLRRQARTLTAQVRMSAAVVGALPVLWLVFGGLGRLRLLAAHGGGMVAVIGISMEALGVVLVWRLAAT